MAKKTENINLQAEEELLVQKEFEALLDDYRNTAHRQKIEIITKAFLFAKNAHKDMRRRSGELYIMHPLSVARIVVSEIGLGSTSICCALLHDVVEDTDYTVEDIQNLFGEKIAQIVDGLTKISGGVFAGQVSAQAENFRKLLLTMSEDIRVILIKIADRLHNMRTLGSMPAAKQYKIAGETQYLYAPLAHRLGLFRIKTELENLSFKYEHPQIYSEIEQQLNVDKEAREKFFKKFTDPIKKRLEETGYDFFLKERVKSVFSIWNKMSKRNIPFNEVYDILALRIVFTPKPGMSEKDQCWMLYSALTEIYKPHPKRIRDWVSTPKANGYEALHVTVMGPNGQWIEIQIRSVRMNDIAEKGLAAHWKYKTSENDESEFDKWMKVIKEILASPEPNALDFLDTFKLNLYASEIFVFTPKGDIKTLAKGSTALDFAFDLHSDLGMRCIGAKVNHKLVPLSHELASGDQVEILTSKKQVPQPEWLNYVITARAKTKLRTHFNKEEKALQLEGQKKIEELLESMELTHESGWLTKIMRNFKLTNQNTLYTQIATGDITLEEIKQILKPKNTNVFSRYLKIPFVGNSENKQKQTEDIEAPQVEKVDRKKTFVISEDEESLKKYHIADCCHPIPGDDVLGYVDDNEIVVIHKRQCNEATKIKSSFGERLVAVEWAVPKSMHFVENLKIEGIDKKGVLIEILRVISEQFGGDIQEINIKTVANKFTGDFYIHVHDTKEIDLLCKNLRKIEEVKSAKRVIESK